MGISPLRQLPLGNFFFPSSVFHTEQFLLMSTNVHCDQYLQQKALLSLSLVIPQVKERVFSGFFEQHKNFNQPLLDNEIWRSRMNINTHGSFSLWWPFLISWQPCDWYCQYPWHKPLLPICQTRAEQQQMAGNTLSVGLTQSKGCWKHFYSNRQKTRKNIHPQAYHFCMLAYFFRNPRRIVSLAKKTLAFIF